MKTKGNLNREVKPIFQSYFEDVISFNARYLNSKIYFKVFSATEVIEKMRKFIFLKNQFFEILGRLRASRDTS